MERGDFISGEAWCKYKFERESKKEEIERLQRKVERANKNLHNRIVYDNIVLTVLSVTTICSISWLDIRNMQDWWNWQTRRIQVPLPSA